MPNPNELQNIRTLDVNADKKQSKALDGPVNVDLKKSYNHLKVHGGKNMISTLVKTMVGPGRLTISEFLYYQLYMDSYNEFTRSQYVGKTIQSKIHRRCNSMDEQDSAHNKLLFQNLLETNDLPHPIQAGVYGASIEANSTGHLMTTKKALSDFLGSEQTYPLFAKPIDGMYSIGAMLLKELNGDKVTLGDNSTTDIEELAQYIVDMSDIGYLFQHPLVAHHHLKIALGDTLPSARLMVLLSDGVDPQVYCATLKIPEGNKADNFWRSGNMLAPINIDDGTISHLVRGEAYDTHKLYEHPDTGVALKGFTLPDWRLAQELVVQASTHFKGIRTQGWDVCFTVDGPVLLELNFGGDLNLHQLSHERGILDHEYCQHLRRCGYDLILPEFENNEALM